MFAPFFTRRALGRLLPCAWLVAAAFAAPAYADTRRYGLTSFDRVEVFGDMIVEIVPSTSIAAVAEASRANLETLSLEVNNRTLVIRQSASGAFGPRTSVGGPIVIRLTAQNLEQVMLRGAGQVRVSGLRGDNVRLDLDGSGRVEAAVAAGTTVTARAIGAGTMLLSGVTRTLSVIVNGAGSVDAAELRSRDLTVRASGTGASRFAASTSAIIYSGGSANIAVAGNARCTVTNVGAGTVACESGRMTVPAPGNR